MTSPTFVCRYSDGVIVRMTTFCEPGHLDLARGLVLAAAAYRSRVGKPPPAVVAASFVRPFTNEVVQSYGSSELGAVS